MVFLPKKHIFRAKSIAISKNNRNFTTSKQKETISFPLLILTLIERSGTVVKPLPLHFFTLMH